MDNAQLLRIKAFENLRKEKAENERSLLNELT